MPSFLWLSFPVGWLFAGLQSTKYEDCKDGTRFGQILDPSHWSSTSELNAFSALFPYAAPGSALTCFSGTKLADVLPVSSIVTARTLVHQSDVRPFFPVTAS